MKKSKFLMLAVTALLLYSCNPVTFDEAQPVNTKALTKFPEKLQGLYCAPDSSSFLLISDSIILKTLDFDELFHKDSLPPGSRIVGDSLQIKYPDDKIEDKLKFKNISDSQIAVHVSFTDTEFKICNNGILKKYKGYYFINHKMEVEKGQYSWVVKKIYIKNGILTVSYVDEVKEIELLPTIDEDNREHIVLKPTKKQFKRFIQDDGFNKADTFYRMQ